MEIINFETLRLSVSPLSGKNYESVTKMFADDKNNSFATGLNRGAGKSEAEKKIEFDSKIDTGFNLVAEEKNTQKFVGYIKGYLFCGKDEVRAAWIYTFMIVHYLRGKGYGKEIIESLFSLLSASRGIEYVVISVLEDNYSALKFWESLKFGTVKTLTKSGVFDDSVSEIKIMIKKI